MAKYKFYVGMGLVKREEIIEYPDDWTEEAIEEEFNTWAWEMIDAGFQKINNA
jgi:hypothetical protein